MTSKHSIAAFGALALGIAVPLLINASVVKQASRNAEQHASQANPWATRNQDNVARGKYLVALGGCGDCHTPLKMGERGPEPDLSRLLSGHPQDAKLPPAELKPGPWFAATAGMTAWAGPWGTTFAANLTPDANTGLGIWTEQMFVQAMRTGKHMGAGRPILPPMPWRNFSEVSDADIKAIFAYLQSVPAIRNQVPDPIPPTPQVAFE